MLAVNRLIQKINTKHRIYEFFIKKAIIIV
jgi:hypothetical protein